MSSDVQEPENLIKKLPPEVFNKIAAGEVVQRPGSVVKELLDNAIDSGADAIRVRVEQAGRTLIRIIDNGCGMSKLDVQLAFEPHTTSKISTADDLFQVQTLGFRGEALASIASVSQVSVVTKRRHDQHGWQYDLLGGEPRSLEPAAAINGTSVTVKNLFFNVPARRAFLKADQTELRHCLSVFVAMALAYPEISFQFESENEVVYNLPKQSMPDRISGLFGKAFKASLVSIREQTQAVTITGFLGDPKLVRKTRGDQFLFVNRRPFQHRFLSRAVLEEYTPWLGEELFPFFALFISVPPASVDVNVHPAKLEVKFDDERGLASLVRSVVKKALFARFGFETSQATADPGQPFSLPGFNSGNQMPFASGGSFPSSGSFNQGGGFSFQRPNYERPAPPPVNAAALLYAPVQKSEEAGSLFHDVAPSRSATPSAQVKTFWQLHNSYILTQTLTGLCVVDQNAAHRRILYERALATANNALPPTQQLLFPQTLDFSATDFQLLKELHAEITQMGFNLQLVSGNSAILTGVPADVEVGDEKTVVHSILAAYTDIGRKMVFSAREKLAAAMAMRLAIPRGKRLSPAEMEQLVDRLFACNAPFTDALGRPTLVYLSLDEIAQRFGART